MAMMGPQVERWKLQTQAVYSKLLESGFPSSLYMQITSSQALCTKSLP